MSEQRAEVEDYPEGWLENDLDPKTAENDSDRQWIEMWNNASPEERAQLLATPIEDEKI